VEVGNRVAVIGGGNAAIDSARTALRLGAKEVTMVYRRTRAEMPASPEEIEEALAEGVQIDFLVAPSRIISQDGRIELECIRMELGELDASGRRRPEPIKGSEFTTSFDTIIAAIGQRPEIPHQFSLATGRGNVIEVDPDTLATSREGVFAGGDAVSGPASVIEAIAAGRRAAISIDKYLGGNGVIDETLAPPEGEVAPLEEAEEKRRPQIPTLPLEQRRNSFATVELELGEEAVIEEAKRCLRCDLEEQE
jgi:NADPH-dependent glutamate synthase beta subunit-like oxidoreductase